MHPENLEARKLARQLGATLEQYPKTIQAIVDLADEGGLRCHLQTRWPLGLYIYNPTEEKLHFHVETRYADLTTPSWRVYCAFADEEIHTSDWNESFKAAIQSLILKCARPIENNGLTVTAYLELVHQQAEAAKLAVDAITLEGFRQQLPIKIQARPRAALTEERAARDWWITVTLEDRSVHVLVDPPEDVDRYYRVLDLKNQWAMPLCDEELKDCIKASISTPQCLAERVLRDLTEGAAS